MGISSLGVGSGILTQSVLDQLRKADDSQRITPLTLKIANENDKSTTVDVLQASMVNLRDAANEMQNVDLFNTRNASVTGTSVSVTASLGSAVQDFTLNVTQLATKQINESGSYSADTALVATVGATGGASMNLSVGVNSYTINYDNTTTLSGLKDAINSVAGSDVTASIVQVTTGDYRLFLNAKNEGSNQNISITDTSGFLSDDGGVTAGGTNLTSGASIIQNGLDANFTYNGQAIVRSSNNVTDLVSGYDITLKELGSSKVSVTQDRTNFDTRVDSFVSQYNAAVTELSKETKSSTNSSVRGIFSGDSIVKNMKTTVQNMMDLISNAGGNMTNYGFSIDRYGVMSVDKTVLHTKMDTNIANVKAFFVGGDYTDTAGTVTTLTGAFSSMYTTVNNMTKTNGDISKVKTNITDNITALTDRKTSATKQLDVKYAILKRKYTAFNTLINKFNSASSIFTQLTTQTTKP